MSRLLLVVLFTFLSSAIFSQKKVLDHSVYDGWQAIGKRSISNNGKWVVYNIDVQEGDNELVIQSVDQVHKINIPRGENAVITEDNRFVIFSIKPLYSASREAKIKKKKAAEQPKDSLGIIELETREIWKKANIQSFKLPEEGAGWVAYQMAKTKDSASNGKISKNKVADSLQLVIDSLQNIIQTKARPNKKRNKRTDNLFDVDQLSDFFEAPDPDEDPSESKNNGTTLVLRNLITGDEKAIDNVSVYYFNKKGGKLLIQQSQNSKDSLSKTLLLLMDLAASHTDTLSRGGNDFKQFVLSEDGRQVAFVAERDSKPRELQKFYKLWYFQPGMDSATLIADNSTAGIEKGQGISEHSNLKFSKSGKRLLFGTAPIPLPKDTSLIEMDLVKVDVWHYKDDYLQPIQLLRVKQDLQKSYLAIYDFEKARITQMASERIPSVIPTKEGDGDYFIGITDTGRRTESQWTGSTKKDIYFINAKDGTKKLVKKNLEGVVYPSFVSPSGKYVTWYDYENKSYFSHDGNQLENISGKIKIPLFIEDYDQPSSPPPYGIMGWQDGDQSVLIYDQYDIWKIDPSGKNKPENVTQGKGRKNNITYRYLKTDMEEKFIDSEKLNLLSVFNNQTKRGGINYLENNQLVAEIPGGNFKDQPYYYASLIKAKEGMTYIYTKENYQLSPDLYVFQAGETEQRLSSINLQQNNYNWGTAELYSWKTFSGKKSTGILYKPENFDSTKKYPMILYFYEKLTDGLFRYQAPSPTPSRLNISFFVSRGFIVFAPDIEYTTGHPAKSAYDYIVSAAKDLSQKKWIDSKNIGIQGQSWGGIQVAQLVTMTDMFKAAWSGAPVANMTSAYGGIRWGTGMNRQFQYEKTQSRIGATLWEKPELYIENSPLFHLPKVKTPMVIMANDEDGAVPWYQGIELFTGLVRLGKPAWLLNYNGEAHNLVQRKNKKDIQIREQQFFDWLLKGAKPAKWITEGVPAINKGKDWGLEVVE